jgi:Transposase DDE domain
MFTTAPLFGKFHSPLQHAAQPLRQRPLHHLESLCAQRIAPALLQPNPSRTNSRQRLYSPKLTFLAFLDQILNPDSSCREAVRQIGAYYQKQPNPKALNKNTSAYCQARARWTVEELTQIRCHLSRHTNSPAWKLALPTLRPLKVIDGTCLNLPDTPENRQAYPQSQDQLPECGFPLLRLVAIFCLESGALLERALAPYTTSENALYQELWPTLQGGDILLGDRNFGSWGALASLQSRGVDGLFRLHASRNADLRQGHYLGRNDRLVTWARPTNKPANMSSEQWQALPAALSVRLVRFRVPTTRGRCKKITLVTTLTDPLLWPVAVLAALYSRRWKIELYLDDIKTTLHLDMLSCRTPAMIHKELEMHLIAYNLLRSIMGEAACVCQVPLERLSFKGTLDTARQYSHILAQVPCSKRTLRQQLYAHMLAAIAQDQVPERPDRFEPRCQKRRPKNYPFMHVPRRQLKAAGKDSLPSRTNRRA